MKINQLYVMQDEWNKTNNNDVPSYFSNVITIISDFLWNIMLVLRLSIAEHTLGFSATGGGGSARWESWDRCSCIDMVLLFIDGASVIFNKEIILAKTGFKAIQITQLLYLDYNVKSLFINVKLEHFQYLMKWWATGARCRQ